MTTNTAAVPTIAKASSPRYPDRLVAFFDDSAASEDARFLAFGSKKVRDNFIAKTIRAGDAEPVHIHCPEPGCTCTFPTLHLPYDPA